MNNDFYGYWEINQSNFKQFEPKLPTDEYTLDSGGWEIVESSAKDFFSHFFPYRRRIIPLDDPEWELVPLYDSLDIRCEAFDIPTNRWCQLSDIQSAFYFSATPMAFLKTWPETRAIRRRKQSVTKPSSPSPKPCNACGGAKEIHPDKNAQQITAPCPSCQPTKPAEPKPDDVCECGHTRSVHYFHGTGCIHGEGEIACKCQQFKRKESDNMQKTSDSNTASMVSQPRPETASAGVGPITFDEWWRSGNNSTDIIRFHDAKAVWDACEASKQPPGRWVLCSERLPVSSTDGNLFTAQLKTGELVSISFESLSRIVSSYPEHQYVAWWEWTYQIPAPLPIEQDEDEKAWIAYCQLKNFPPNNCPSIKTDFMAGRRSK